MSGECSEGLMTPAQLNDGNIQGSEALSIFCSRFMVIISSWRVGGIMNSPKLAGICCECFMFMKT